MIELQRSTDKEKWDEYVLEHDGHPLQLWEWGQVKAAHGWSADRVFIYSDGDPDHDPQLIGAAQILVRKLPWPLKSFAYVPRGPVGLAEGREEALEALGNYAKREYHAVTLAIEPDSVEYEVPETWHRAKNHVLPAQTIILDLNKSESDLLTDMVKKTRQYIRKSAAEKVEIKRIRTKEELAKCLDLYHHTSKRAKFDLHDDSYYYDVFAILGEHSPVFASYYEGEPIAFLWLAISADTAFELYGGMNEIGQDLRANYALKWHAIRKTKEWGLSRYDFGGLLGGGEGVTTFKKSWATDETHLAGTFEVPLSSSYGLWNGGLPAAKKIVRALRRR
jgi:peptidoglycan pentaglycine glycine transferase (the first glycine)